MKSNLVIAAAILTASCASPAVAALAVGDSAPDFVAEGTQDGSVGKVDLAGMRRNGPVVIFFFPSAFTDAQECRDFVANIDGFRAAGASVVGISRDSVDTLTHFSTEECASKFPLASASESLVNAFDVNDGAMFNTRTTYVVATSGKIVFVDDDPDFAGHARSVLAFLRGMAR